MDFGQVLSLLLGGGAVATVTAVFNGLKSLREGARVRERDAIQDLIERRRESDGDKDKAFDARDRAFTERDYWRDRCGVREFQLRQTGVPLAEYPDPPNFPTTAT